MDPLDISISQLESIMPEQGWTVRAGKKHFRASMPTIELSEIPVKRPSVRGGVYFVQKQAYKMSCNIEADDLSHLTSCMLGPNRDFEPILIFCPSVTFTANLVGYVESGNTTRLNLQVTKISLGKD